MQDLSWRGRLEGIFITEAQSLPMQEIAEAKLIEGVGIEGDRYATGKGKYSVKPGEDRQVTLIEMETIEAIRRDHRIALEPVETRRNLVTRGVPLNHLVGRSFSVGEVVLFGCRLNAPCKYLEGLLGKPVYTPLLNRSGLNCRIVRGGVVRAADAVRPA
ncbi:MAG: MOSC domain-containing protein [Betaproteobacteria bacterium]|nr:MOSC domain-containing protein [Betaproteobacteria bacterium]